MTSNKRSTFRAPIESDSEPSERNTDTETDTDTGLFDEAPEHFEPEPETKRSMSKEGSPKGKETAEHRNHREIRIHAPKPFTGDRNDVTRFLQDVELYLLLNDPIYDQDAKKIAFVLSYMNEGPALAWKEAFLEEKLTTGSFIPGTYATFRATLLAAFSPSDVAGRAQAELRNLKQTGPADEYVSQFRILAGKSKIEDDGALIEYFMEGLKPKLLEKIYALEKLPITIIKWYEHVSRFDNQWTRVREIIARNNKTTSTPTKRTNYAPRYVTPHDPNAMDIDRMTKEETETKHDQIPRNQEDWKHRIFHDPIPIQRTRQRKSENLYGQAQ